MLLLCVMWCCSVLSCVTLCCETWFTVRRGCGVMRLDGQVSSLECRCCCVPGSVLWEGCKAVIRHLCESGEVSQNCVCVCVCVCDKAISGRVERSLITICK